MGQTGSRTNKNSIKKIRNNDIAPKGDQSKKFDKENKIIGKNDYHDEIANSRRHQYLSPGARQDLDRIFMY
jgi:hypothetical protein